MQTLHEAAPSEVDMRNLAGEVGEALNLRVEIGPEPVRLTGAADLVGFALRALITTVVENRPSLGQRT